LPEWGGGVARLCRLQSKCRPDLTPLKYIDTNTKAKAKEGKERQTERGKGWERKRERRGGPTAALNLPITIRSYKCNNVPTQELRFLLKKKLSIGRLFVFYTS
jgi:hypothetical protein